MMINQNSCRSRCNAASKTVSTVFLYLRSIPGRRPEDDAVLLGVGGMGGPVGGLSYDGRRADSGYHRMDQHDLLAGIHQQMDDGQASTCSSDNDNANGNDFMEVSHEVQDIQARIRTR